MAGEHASAKQCRRLWKELQKTAPMPLGVYETFISREVRSCCPFNLDTFPAHRRTLDLP